MQDSSSRVDTPVILFDGLLSTDLSCLWRLIMGDASFIKQYKRKINARNVFVGRWHKAQPDGKPLSFPVGTLS